MGLTNNQRAQVTTLLTDINRCMVKYLSDNKKFTGHINFDISVTSGGICSTTVNTKEVLPLSKQ